MNIKVAALTVSEKSNYSLDTSRARQESYKNKYNGCCVARRPTWCVEVTGHNNDNCIGLRIVAKLLKTKQVSYKTLLYALTVRIVGNFAWYFVGCWLSFQNWPFRKFISDTIRVSNSSDQGEDQTRRFGVPNLGPNCMFAKFISVRPLV